MAQDSVVRLYHYMIDEKFNAGSRRGKTQEKLSMEILKNFPNPEKRTHIHMYIKLHVLPGGRG